MPEKITNQMIKHILNDLKKDIGEIKMYVISNNGRIKSLELWRARMAGALVVISALLIPTVARLLSEVATAYFN